MIVLSWQSLSWCISPPLWLSWMRGRLVIRMHVQPPSGQQYSFMEIHHEIFSMVIFSIFKKGSCQFLVKECAQYLAWPCRPSSCSPECTNLHDQEGAWQYRDRRTFLYLFFWRIFFVRATETQPHDSPYDHDDRIKTSWIRVSNKESIPMFFYFSMKTFFFFFFFFAVNVMVLIGSALVSTKTYIFMGRNKYNRMQITR